MQRRSFLIAASTLAASLFEAHWLTATIPESQWLDQEDLVVDGDRRLARRALLLLPRRRQALERIPLLVLLHGLGETSDEKLGIHAWGERYGLISSYERLMSPPVGRTLNKVKYLTNDYLNEINASFRSRAFSPMALLCPFTPNVYKLPPAAQALDRYADWIDTILLPAVRKRAPVALHRERTALDGCSLGGYVGLEVFLRKPHLFGSWGGVQAAFGQSTADRYADRIAAVVESQATAVRLGTSTGDPYRKANERLSRALMKHGIPHTLSIHPGPHNQPWLREVGTLSMLLWHDRVWGNRTAQSRTRELG